MYGTQFKNLLNFTFDTCVININIAKLRNKIEGTNVFIITRYQE